MPGLIIASQSNGALAWTPDGVIGTEFLATLQALVDPTNGVPVTLVAGPMDGATAPTSKGTLCSGTGIVISYAAQTETAGYMGTASSDLYFTPRRPSHGSFGPSDWPTWPETNRGSGLRQFLEGQTAPVKAGCGALLIHHWEWDGCGCAGSGPAGANAAWVNGDTRVLNWGIRRHVGAIRTAVGRTAAELPCYVSMPGLLSNRAQGETGSIQNAGYRYLLAVYAELEADAAFNFKLLDFGAIDLDWNREWLVDQTGGEYGPHGNISDYRRQFRRLAYVLANELGPRWNPSGYTMRVAAKGPRAYHAQRIDDSTVDVWLQHDGGSDIVLDGDSTVGWKAWYGGIAVGVTGVTRQAANRLRLTLASACRCAELLSVAYGWDATRVRLANTTLDNRLSVDGGRLVPSVVTGANRIDGALRRTIIPLPVSRGEPAARLS